MKVFQPFLLIFDQFSHILRISHQKVLGAYLFEQERLFSTVLCHATVRQSDSLSVEKCILRQILAIFMPIRRIMLWHCHSVCQSVHPFFYLAILRQPFLHIISKAFTAISLKLGIYSFPIDPLGGDL